MTTNTPKYTFVPWSRQGLGTLLSATDSDNANYSAPSTHLHDTLTANIKLGDQYSNEKASFNQDLILHGNGDVKSINPQSIVRVEPVNGFDLFEPNYFPYIEFYDEDLPWRFSPHMPSSGSGNRLKPWMFLAVLEAGPTADLREFDEQKQVEGRLASVLIRPLSSAATQKIPLPDFTQLWATAHVHINSIDITNSSLYDHLTDAAQLAKDIQGIQSGNPDAAFSRLLGMRKLDPGKQYRAFLLPAYEAGRLKGLGLPNPDADVRRPAWSAGDVSKIFPVYYSWSFKTATGGDFEKLVTDLKPVKLANILGTKKMDMTKANNVLKTSFGSTATLQPNMYVKSVLTPGAPLQVNDLQSKKLMIKFLALAETLRKKTTANLPSAHPLFPTSDFTEDPIVLPPIYGQWHLAKLVIYPDQSGNPQSDWFSDLNLDPQFRTIASLGTQVVQDNQDFFMDYAWKQVGDIIEANKKIAMMELALQITQRLLDKHVKKLQEADKLLPLTGMLHNKVSMTGGSSVKNGIEGSALPTAAQNQAFRKLITPRGRLGKSLNRNAGISDPVASGLQKSIISNLNSNVSPAKSFKPKANLDLASAVQSNIIVQAKNNQVGISSNDVDKAVTTNSFAIVEEASLVASPSPASSADLSAIATLLIGTLEPTFKFGKRLDMLFNVKTGNTVNYNTSVRKTPYAYPKFPFVMFDYLSKISTDYILPDANKIPYNTISLLNSSQSFIEAFMVGLNHEMGREMLWREFPTDQRGSYFRRFWDRTDNLKAYAALGTATTEEQRDDVLSDIAPIHTWGDGTLLGKHQTPYASGDDQMVVMIRGDVMKKFPNTIVYLQKAKYALKGNNQPDKDVSRDMVQVADADLTTSSNIKFPIFHSRIEPDIIMLGFDISPQEAKGTGAQTPKDSDGSGWFVVLKERPGQTKFGLDLASTNNPSTADISSWDQLRQDQVQHNHAKYLDAAAQPTHLTSGLTQWNKDSANLANIIYQGPAMVAIHASDMLKSL